MAAPVLSADCHTHNFRCHHAQGEVTDYAASALEKGLKIYGASDHIPLRDAYQQGPRMEWDVFPSYRQAVLEARDRWQGRIEVLYGIEADYDENPRTVRDFEEIAAREELDYAIGSVHGLNGRTGGGPYGAIWSLVERAGEVEREELLIRYFRLIGEMAGTRVFDIVGHFDVAQRCTGWKERPRGLLEKAVLGALDAIAGSGMALEINTSGFHHPMQVQFPDWWMLIAAVERGIPLMVNSDAHRPSDVARDFDRIAAGWGQLPAGARRVVYRGRKQVMLE
ncbi:MAG: histidinol-phosphatase [Verrucomicrobiae bacterium]|nr:histidinol-phosphatase [Verrucomicrobiae bacterium]